MNQQFTHLIKRLGQCITGTAIALSSCTVMADQFFQDDLVVKGSACIGVDCASGENFNFDTIRMKENNLRIKFQDTSSSSSFPTVDWQITANDSSNGGLNKFSIEDITIERVPFTILSGAPTNSFYMLASGYIGLGTTTPQVNLQIKEGNSPTIRLQQDNSSGFSEQTWDIGGNETNFFVRDVTNNGLLPFRIQPSAPNGSIFIAADGDVGFETLTPDGQFDVAHVTDANNHAFLISPTSYVGVNIDNGFLPQGWFDVQTTGGKSKLTVASDGDVGVGTAAPTGRFDVRDSADTKSYLTVDANGHLGVGTNAPSARLHVKNSAGTKDLIAVTDGGELVIGGTSSTPFFGGAVNPELNIIGASGEFPMLAMTSNSTAETASLIFSAGSDYKWLFASRNQFSSDTGVNADRFAFYNATSLEVMTLDQSGNIGFNKKQPAHPIDTGTGAHLTTGGVWTNNSSRDEKQDIHNISADEAMNTVQSLNPVTFRYNAEPEETYAGFIAEEVPEMVATSNRKSLASMDIVAVLTKVVQEQQKTIETLNKRLQKLEENSEQE